MKTPTRSPLGRLLAAAATLGLAAASPVAWSSPLISINSQADYQTAIDDDVIRPILAPSPIYGAALDSYYGALDPDWLYVAPQIAATSSGQVGGINPAEGLVMSWGDDTQDHTQVAAWEYDYGVDPDLSHTLLTIVITPPPCAGPACITDVSLSLFSTAFGGGAASWFWTVGGASPVQPGLPFLITIDPNVMGNQSGSAAFRQTGIFDVTTVISIAADERSVAPGGAPGGPPNPNWTNFPTVPAVPGNIPWNYWGPLNVVHSPEPGALGLLALGLLVVAAAHRGQVAARRR